MCPPKDEAPGARLSICFAGPLLGKNQGWVQFPAETIAPFLQQRGYRCLLTSSAVNRYLRSVDIVRTVYRNRRRIDILCLQVYAEASFVVEDLVSRLAKGYGIPVVMVLHGGTIPDFSRRHPCWFKTVLSRASKIICPSPYLQRVANESGFPAAIIHNPIDLSRYAFRMRTGLRPRLLWMRTFQEWWNPEMALRVFAGLRLDYPGATLTMAGQEKGLLERMKQLAYALGVKEAVAFPGLLKGEAKISAFESHDIFINTTRIDNMPVTLLEAAACGLPIVSTAAGGIADIFTDKRDALLVSVNDVQAMTEAAHRLLQDAGLAQELSRNARRIAEQCDVGEVVAAWEEVFDQLAH